jgi:hypothetical protein
MLKKYPTASQTATNWQSKPSTTNTQADSKDTTHCSPRWKTTSSRCSKSGSGRRLANSGLKNNN